MVEIATAISFVSIGDNQQGERDGVERCIPEEKPMNTFSFVLKGEELELYNQHKGWNKCREAMKALQPLPDKE